MARRKGIPSIRQRKDRNGNKLDCWEAMITLGRDPGTGKVKRLPVYGKTQEECRKKLVETLHSIQTQTFTEPHKITVENWLDTWLVEYKKGNVRPTTYSSYEYIIRVHIKPKLGKAYLKDLRPEQIQKFYNERKASGLSARTVRYIHVVLCGAIEQAIKNGLIVRNVTDSATLPRNEKKEMRVLTIEEQKRFMRVLEGERLGLAFKLDLSTGLRKGELLALRWKDVDLKEGVIRVQQSLYRAKTNFTDEGNKTEIIFQEPKTKKGKRSIPLFPSMVVELKKHRQKQLEERAKAGGIYQNNDLIFCTELGKPIEPRNLSRRFYILIKKAGIEKTNFHALRHSFATRMLENNENPKIVQEMLGHSTISLTLDTYSHVMPELKKAAIEKLSSLFDDNTVTTTRKAK